MSAFFGRSFSASEPVLTISPQPAHQPSLGSAPYECDLVNFSQSNLPNSWSQPAVQTGTGAGRKRSRDEAAVNLNDDAPLPAPIEPIKESEEDWVYGEGMVLIKPGAGYVADATSQSGTWVEEQVVQEETRRAEAAKALQQQQNERPILRSFKSQRLEQSSAASPGQDTASPCPGSTASSAMTAIPTLSSDAVTQPVVDDFTLHLGIGWRRISDDEHIQAAARGWARYIENHYAISAASIRLESKGLQSYLVEAAEGYYLFAENLKQGRLVSRTVERALANLKNSPPVFDGHETMEAAETPKPLDSVLDATPSAEVDVEMDLS
jgi:hypothetical protein